MRANNLKQGADVLQPQALEQVSGRPDITRRALMHPVNQLAAPVGADLHGVSFSGATIDDFRGGAFSNSSI